MDKKPRRVKVGRRYLQRAGGVYGVVPELRLSGGWLSAQGFKPGDRVELAVRAGELVIKAAG